MVRVTDCCASDLGSIPSQENYKKTSNIVPDKFTPTLK